MRKFVGLSVALMLAMSGIFGIASSASANVPAITCNPSGGPGSIGGVVPVPVSNPGVTVPSAVPVLGGAVLVGNQNPCADLHRTLVFIGTADISNGVNFAGNGADTNGTEPPFGTAGGGSYNYTGDCVMVNWDSPAASAVASRNLTPTDCFFNTVNGTYSNPSQANPVINPVGTALGGVNPALAFDPQLQASCFNSSGTGTATFTAKGLDRALTPPGTTETWTSNYNWNNSLDNLRGTISGTDSHGNNLGSHSFDAKIEAHADPAALAGGLDPKSQFTTYDAFDTTDAGCLQKTLAKLGVPGTGNANANAIGINDILIVGTSTWDTVTPETIV